MRVLRCDYYSLPSAGAQRTPQGGLKVPAYLTRTGVFVYTGPDGAPIREYRPPEEVFARESLDQLRGAPLALDHPPETIKPENFRAYAVGYVGEDVRRDGDRVAASVYVQDQAAIKAIEAGRRELSCGYHVDVDETPGVTPSGEAYDRVQRNIRYNHVALVPDGRAGHDVRLRLDAKGNQKGTKMRRDGSAYVYGQPRGPEPGTSPALEAARSGVYPRQQDYAPVSEMTDDELLSELAHHATVQRDAEGAASVPADVIRTLRRETNRAFYAAQLEQRVPSYAGATPDEQARMIAENTRRLGYVRPIGAPPARPTPAPAFSKATMRLPTPPAYDGGPMPAHAPSFAATQRPAPQPPLRLSKRALR